MTKHHLEYVVVAFLDLLGQRDRLRTLRKMPETKEEEEHAIGIMRNTAHVAIDLRKDLEEFYSSFTIGNPEKAPNESKDSGGVDPEVLATAPKITTYGMSDAVVMAVQLGSPRFDHLPLMGVHRILAASTMAMVKYLGLGHPLRGGIEVAPGAIINGEIFGPALAMAYDLESHFAEYPRVILGPQIQEFLSEAIVEQGFHDDHQQRAVRFAQGSLSFLAYDHDGRAILDYLKAGARNFEDEQSRAEVYGHILRFVQGQLREYELDHRKEKLRARYHRLLQYLNCHRERWLPDEGGS